MTRAALRTAALALMLAAVAFTQTAGHAQQAQPQGQADDQKDQQPGTPPVFRAGINYVRVDVIVSDKNGANVADLKQSDFEVTEDGRPQSVETFKFIKLDGGTVPSPDGPPRAIHTDEDEEAEAAKDDVRLFSIF